MQPNSTKLYNADSEWVAVVKEDGVETRRSFMVREHAVSWLDGQSVRLGLPEGSYEQSDATTDSGSMPSQASGG